MSILDNIKNFFTSEVEVETKATEELGRIIAPVFREIPPDGKSGKFVVEGIRSWAFIAMSAIADEISTTDIGLFKNTNGDCSEIMKNQILDVIEKPNAFQTKEELFWLMTMYLLAEGEAPLLLNNSSNPTELILLQPNRLKVIYSETETVGSYTYTKSNGGIQTLDKDLVVFLKLPGFSTPFRGMGVMKYISQTLDIDNYMEEYLRLFFFNDATPGSVLETDKVLSKTSYARLKGQLKEKHKGYKKAFKNLILENGLKWKEIGTKLNELQIKELQNETRDKILSAFKVPKSILGITEDVNRSNGETSDLVFAKRCIKPKLKLIEAQLNVGFVSKFSGGENMFLQFEDPVKEDMKLQAEIDQIYVNSGILTINEIRERMELKPKEEEPIEEPVEEPKVDEEKTVSDNIFIDVMKDFVEKSPKEEFTQVELEKFHDDKIMFIDKVEEEYKEKLQGFFKRQEKRVLSKVKNIDFDKKLEEEEMIKITTPYLKIVVEKESELAFALLGLSGRYLSSQDDLVKKFIRDRSIKLGKTTAKTSKEAIDRIFNDWSKEEGASVASLKKALREYYDDIARVNTIARTELSNAVGFAQEEVYKETGAIGKEWITARDERVCEFCRGMDRKVAKINSSFWDKNETMVGADGGIITFDYESITSPPLHANCRCDLIPVYKESHIVDDYKEKNQEALNKVEAEEKKIKEIEKKELKLKKKEKELKEIEKALNEDINELSQLDGKDNKKKED